MFPISCNFILQVCCLTWLTYLFLTIQTIINYSQGDWLMMAFMDNRREDSSILGRIYLPGSFAENNSTNV